VEPELKSAIRQPGRHNAVSGGGKSYETWTVTISYNWRISIYTCPPSAWPQSL